MGSLQYQTMQFPDYRLKISVRTILDRFSCLATLPFEAAVTSVLIVFTNANPMPLGNDSRASRRPMPRQLDMSGWNVDSSSATQDGDQVPSTSIASRDSNDLNYRRTREEPDRFDSFRDDAYQPRRASAREELQRPLEMRPIRTSEYDGLSTGQSSVGASTFDTTFTSVASSRGFPSGGSSIIMSKSDREIRQDIQREVDDVPRYSRFGSAEPWRSERTSRESFRRTSERNDADFTGPPGYTQAELFTSRTSFDNGRSDNDARLRISGAKADSIREAESPVAVRGTSTSKVTTRENNEPTRKAPNLNFASLASGFGNQDEHPSPTHSETSIPPASPASDRDSVPQRMRDHYPKPSIPSPISSDKSNGRKRRVSSPCSSVSTTSSRTPTARTKHSSIPQLATQSAMSDLREDLYAFRKQMREVFIRVEDMVDAHRSFFKSDPSTGSPVFREKLQQETEQLANEAFEQLADLRNHFSRLSKDFQRSEQPAEMPVAKREQRTILPRTEELIRPSGAQRAACIHSTDDESSSMKGSELPEDDVTERFSVASDEALTIEHSPSIHGRRGSSHLDSDDDAVIATTLDSVRSTASTYLSSQLPSRWRENASEDSVMSDTNNRTRTRRRSPSIVSDASSLPDQCSKASEPDADNIFKDFDKRMEQIRCSLNAIASGNKLPQSHSTTAATVAVPPTNFTTGGAGSPIRAMMDATRTRSTLREALRISRRHSHDDEEDKNRPRPGDREAELRRLLQELNHINASNEANDD